VPAKRTGKKDGKGTVNPGDGFASVASDGRRKQLVPEFISRQNVASLENLASSYF